jgi:hypothetical protein
VSTRCDRGVTGGASPSPGYRPPRTASTGRRCPEPANAPRDWLADATRERRTSWIRVPRCAGPLFTAHSSRTEHRFGCCGTTGCPQKCHSSGAGDRQTRSSRRETPAASQL